MFQRGVGHTRPFFSTNDLISCIQSAIGLAGWRDSDGQQHSADQKKKK